jgi:transcriptional regulator with PAS, ATPase and Fis domain
LHEGKIRADFYYRLCADVITTASLREEIEETPGALQELILYIARGLAGDAGQALAQEVDAWIARHLGPDYPWPGNIRELEQCVRSILIRKDYKPLRRPRPEADDLVRALRARRLTAEELLRLQCTVAYTETGSYAAVAARLGLDRRTVKARIDMQLLGRIGPLPGTALPV